MSASYSRERLYESGQMEMVDEVRAFSDFHPSLFVSLGNLATTHICSGKDASIRLRHRRFRRHRQSDRANWRHIRNDLRCCQERPGLGQTSS